MILTFTKLTCGVGVFRGEKWVCRICHDFVASLFGVMRRVGESIDVEVVESWDDHFEWLGLWAVRDDVPDGDVNLASRVAVFYDYELDIEPSWPGVEDLDHHSEREFWTNMLNDYRPHWMDYWDFRELFGEMGVHEYTLLWVRRVP